MGTGDTKAISRVPLDAMTTQALHPTATLEQLVTNIRLSRKITRRDQRLLMAFGSQMGLSDSHLKLLGQVYDLLHQGYIRVVD